MKEYVLIAMVKSSLIVVGRVWFDGVVRRKKVGKARPHGVLLYP